MMIFLTGFVTTDRNVWGRPVGVAVARDGALLMTEDANGTMWRISYTGGPPVLSTSLVEADGQRYLAVTFTRSPGTDYTVEVSADLLTWTSGPGQTVTITDTPTQLVVRDTTPYQNAGARYIRVRVLTP